MWLPSVRRRFAWQIVDDCDAATSGKINSGVVLRENTGCPSTAATT
ncbi:hypothetical protein ACFOHY_02155 [Rhizobium rosettiformans]